MLGILLTILAPEAWNLMESARSPDWFVSSFLTFRAAAPSLDVIEYIIEELFIPDSMVLAKSDFLNDSDAYNLTRGSCPGFKRFLNSLLVGSLYDKASAFV